MNLSLSSLGYARVGVATPELRVADIPYNCEAIWRAVDRATDTGCQILVLPELCVTSYSCGDLFYQSLLVEKAFEALSDLARYVGGRGLSVVLGAPIAEGGRLFNCAAFLSGGRIRGIVPKTFLPNTQEFYEERWFSSSRDRRSDMIVRGGEFIPFGEDLLFTADNMPGCVVGIEICEDLWSVTPPSSRLATAGATLLLNLSASPETLGKSEYRRSLVLSQSARCLAAYAYASAGPGESSTDLVYSGHSLIAENGVLLSETPRFSFSCEIACADIDIDHLDSERRRNASYAFSDDGAPFRRIPFELKVTEPAKLKRHVDPDPFVPSRTGERADRCREIFLIQTTGLAKRLLHTETKRVVIGVSGGLDSTLALLVAVKAFDRLGLDRAGILAVTMPGLGTTERTRGNAEKLAALLETTLEVVPIHDAVLGHFRDIGHDETVHDITFENAQARERTQILMDLANRVGGIVIGTGDLSELALGWCTYNADHMSMYGVNAGVPKTLVRYLVSWCAEEEFSGEVSAILEDVCRTPVSPELLPPGEDGEIRQVTEDHLGPYRLHDFFLYHVVRLNEKPTKVFLLARQAFAQEYPPKEILRWLKVFYRRFFSQQFKRSCLPDGPKVGSVALSPRGDWRMPSDASVALWLGEVDGIEVGD